MFHAIWSDIHEATADLTVWYQAYRESRTIRYRKCEVGFKSLYTYSRLE